MVVPEPFELTNSGHSCCRSLQGAGWCCRLCHPCRPSRLAQAESLDWSEFPLIRKTPRPGFGTWMGAQPANTCSTLWQVRLETLRGVRLEVGLGTADSLKIGVMARKKTWLFDCWGAQDARERRGVLRWNDA